MSPAKMPPFSSVLKSREVEDPINVGLHRPLAYAFAWLVFPTPITPNMVTFLAMFVGIASGGCFLDGSRGAMIAGGLLLWASAILDGADGILARAKNMQSDFGRAVDGASDMIVSIFSVLPALYHLWVQQHSPWHAALMLPAIVSAQLHLTGYDYNKEDYLRMTRLDRGGEGEDPNVISKKLDEARTKGWASFVATKYILLPYLISQQKQVRISNPVSLRNVVVRRSEATVEVYREHNYLPMRIWAWISLAPHSYLMAMCAIADHLEIYLYLRVIVMNVLFAIVVVWQRRATAATIAEYERMGVLGRSPETAAAA